MKLYRYFGRRFLQSFARVFAVLALLIFVIETLENVRGLSKYGVEFSEAIILAATSAPAYILQTMPIIIMLSALAFCVGVARSNEFVVSRAVGVSALRSMAFPALYAFLLGMTAILFLNPLAATFSTKHAELRAEYTNSARQAVSFSDDGFWLRQKDEIGHTVIHAQSTNRFGTSLRGALALKFDENGDVISRTSSRNALLNNDEWIFVSGKHWDISRSSVNPENTSHTYAIRRFPTDITPAQILDGYPEPNSIPIWDLPRMIRSIDEAGFSNLPHLIHLHIELARPLMLIAMTIIGAAFTLQNARLGNLGVSVFLALVCGFSLYFLQNLAMTLGEAGEIPVLVAAWAPPLSATLLALGLFLKFEDG
ncbi:MAG: LPS export ABC transporter permease LptG [Rhodobacteraceae bacterium]|nr:LPS export ABC transporter permease LptG [Paracoccaceae bacterium]